MNAYDELFGKKKRPAGRPYVRVLTIRLTDSQSRAVQEIDLEERPEVFLSEPEYIREELHRKLDVLITKMSLSEGGESWTQGPCSSSPQQPQPEAEPCAEAEPSSGSRSS